MGDMAISCEFLGVKLLEWKTLTLSLYWLVDRDPYFMAYEIIPI